MSALALGVTLLFLIFPLLSLPFILIGYFYDPRRRFVYSLLFGVFMGIIAYQFTPPQTYDLFRHHELISEYMTYSWTYFLQVLTATAEPLQAIINYAVSLTRNVNVIQFGIVAIGYTILLSVIGDAAKRYEVAKRPLFFALLFIVSSFTLINFFSGLWNYLAMLIFTLALYLDFAGKKPKIISYLLYILTPLIHSGMFFPFILLIIFKLFREKIGIFMVAVALLVFVAPAVLLPTINSLVTIPIFSQLEPMYTAYFLNGSQYMNLYGGNVLIMELLKLAPCIVLALVYAKSQRGTSLTEINKIAGFTLLLLVSTLVLVVNSIVFLRFVLLAQFIVAPLMLVFLSRQKSEVRIGFTIYLLATSIVYILYQYMTLRGLDFNHLVPGGLLNNIWQLLSK